MTIGSEKRCRGVRCSLSTYVVEHLERRTLLSGSFLEAGVQLANGGVTFFDNDAIVGNKVVFFTNSQQTIDANDPSAYAGAIYDATTEQLTPLTAPSNDYEDFTSAAGVDNEALFTGASDSTGSQSTSIVDIYHLDTGQWTTANLSVARGVAAAVTVGQKVIFAGGQIHSASGWAPSTAIDIFNAQANQWSASSMPFADVVNGFAIGDDAVFVGRAHVQSYDTDTGEWTSKSLPSGFVPNKALVVGSEIVMPAGDYLDRRYVYHVADYAEVYDAATGNLFRVLLVWGGIDLTGTVVGNTAYFLGTKSVPTARHVGVNVAYAFDPASEAFTSISVPREYIEPVSGMSLGGKAIYCGPNFEPLASSQSAATYDPAADLWTSYTGTADLAGGMAIAIDNQIVELFHGLDAIAGDPGIGILTATATLAPSLLSPINQITVNTRHPTFFWTALPGATSYGITVDGFDGLTQETNAPSFTPATPLSAGLHTWYVTANLPDGQIVSTFENFVVAGPLIRARVIATTLPAASHQSTAATALVRITNEGNEAMTEPFTLRVLAVSPDQANSFLLYDAAINQPIAAGDSLTLDFPFSLGLVPTGKGYQLGIFVSLPKRVDTNLTGQSVAFWADVWHGVAFKVSRWTASAAVSQNKIAADAQLLDG